MGPRLSTVSLCLIRVRAIVVPLTRPASVAFRTDTDISGAANGPRERELRAWQPEGSSSAGAPDHNGVNRDNQTFGLNQPNGQWDQFAANEKLFGVTTDFNEEIYTTKLDRNTTDFKERERKAQQLANEIQGVREQISKIDLVLS